MRLQLRDQLTFLLGRSFLLGRDLVPPLLLGQPPLALCTLVVDRASPSFLDRRGDHVGPFRRVLRSRAPTSRSLIEKHRRLRLRCRPCRWRHRRCHPRRRAHPFRLLPRLRLSLRLMLRYICTSVFKPFAAWIGHGNNSKKATAWPPCAISHSDLRHRHQTTCWLLLMLRNFRSPALAMS